MAKSRAAKKLYMKRLSRKAADLFRFLASVDDATFLQLIWAVNVLQSERRPPLQKYLRPPREAVTTDLSSVYYVQKWELETLVLLLFYTAKAALNEHFDYGAFQGIVEPVNLLKSVEDAEGGLTVHVDNVIMELHRIGHRQFPWQRGYFNTEKLYRFYYVYGQGGCAAFFEKEYGLTIAEFAQAAIFLFFQLHHTPWSAPIDLTRYGARPEVTERALPLLSMDIEHLRTRTRTMIENAGQTKDLRVSYLPSSIREFPVISASHLPGKYHAPLPQLIIFRATSGLYYDLRRGPQILLDEANRRFEEYARKIINARLPRFEVLKEQAYGTKKLPRKTPDVMIRDAGCIVAVIECKATKLTFDAQYAEDPSNEAKWGYEQIANGIAQLWRFFSHARRGIYSTEAVDPDAHGVLLSMDAWMQMSRNLQTHVFGRAEELVANEPEVITADKRRIIFAPVEELDDVLAISDEDEFLATLRAARDQKFNGWMLRNIRQQLSDTAPVRKPYPFHPKEFLPWWDKLP